MNGGMRWEEFLYLPYVQRENIKAELNTWNPEKK